MQMEHQIPMEPAPAHQSVPIVEDKGGEAEVGIRLELPGEALDLRPVGHLQRLEVRKEGSNFPGNIQMGKEHVNFII